MDFNSIHLLHRNVLKYAKNKKLVIFGVGDGAVQTVIALGPLFERVAYFVDNNWLHTTGEFYNKPVYSADILLNEIKDEVYILVASTYFEDIFRQLNKYGFNDKYYVQTIYPMDQDANHSRKTNRVINGVKVGKYSYGYEAHCFRGSTLQEIGSFCSINETVLIGNITSHPTNLITTHPFLYKHNKQAMGILNGFLEEEKILKYESNAPVIIKNDVWIGANTVILSGITIGNGAIIGAGSIVTKDIPPYAIVGGVPARIIRYRFTKEEIQILEKIKWWDWPIENIKDEINLFKNPDLFFGKYRELLDNFSNIF